MHLYLFLRGKIEFINLLEAHLQAQYFRLRKTHIKTGAKVEKLVQLAVRRSVMGAYELIFPKEALAEVLAMLGVVSSEHTGAFQKQFLDNMRFSVLRKIFACKKISKKIFAEAKEISEKRSTLVINGTERGLSNCIIPGTAVHVIGIKSDKIGVIPGQDYQHELL